MAGLQPVNTAIYRWQHFCIYYSPSFGVVVVGESRTEIKIKYIQNSKLNNFQHFVFACFYI